jgi:hypothetical protein
MRGPATSVSTGATTSAMPVRSSCQEMWRKVAAVTPGDAVIAMVSHRALRAAGTAPVSGPRSGTPPGVAPSSVTTLVQPPTMA